MFLKRRVLLTRGDEPFELPIGLDRMCRFSDRGPAELADARCRP
jgi:hypothetical protein